MKKIILTLSFILASLSIVSAQSQFGMMSDGQFTPMNQGMMGSGMMSMMQMMSGYGSNYGFGSGMMILGWITYLLVIILIISAIYWLIKSANKK